MEDVIIMCCITGIAIMLILCCCCCCCRRRSYPPFRFTEWEPRYYPFSSIQGSSQGHQEFGYQSYQSGSYFRRTESLKRDPWQLEPSEFNAWYDREIVGPFGFVDFREECGRVVNQVVQIMYQHVPLNVKEVVKGGSLGKGTMLRGDSDIDCVVLVNSLPYLKAIQDVDNYVKTQLDNAISHIEIAVDKHSKVVRSRRNKFMCTATLSVSGLEVDVDLVPTADNLSYERTPYIYESMLERNSDEREFYSAGLVKLQVDFIRSKPGVVKELIRLMKYWNKHTVKSALPELQEKVLPKSYPMELITIYAWEKAGSPYRFDRLKGFKAVLTLIGHRLHTIHHFWTINYTTSMAHRAIESIDEKWSSKKSPLILDPANPTNNVCGRYHETWKDVARVARDTLDSNLLRDIRVGTYWE